MSVDLGRRRIGLAVGDSEQGIASPLPVLSASGSLRIDAAAIASLCKHEDASAVAVGVPFQDGESSDQASACLRLAEELRRLGLQVYEIDESLTTVDAQERMRQAGLSAAQRRARVDSAAACLILERCFESL